MSKWSDAEAKAEFPDDWDLGYLACTCEETAPRADSRNKVWYRVPCEGASGGRRLSWRCKMGHMSLEFDAGRDPIGKGGTPFRVSAAEGWTQMGAHKENTDAARAEGRDLQLISRS
jgi:hypothetical protein